MCRSEKRERFDKSMNKMILLRLFLVVVVFGMIFAGTVSAGEVQKNEGWDAHESHTRMHFKDNEMEFSLALILGLP